MKHLDYTLYLVTDRSCMTSPTLEEGVEQAILGGCTMVQLREKEASAREFLETARRVQTITRRYSVPLIINDRVDLALAVDADGVHVGQQDLPCSVVRSLVGPEKIIGVSAATLAEAKQAQTDGATYLGVGAMNATTTKINTRSVTPAQLAEIKAAVAIPVVAIGGIHPATLANLSHTGVDGIAVVSAILAQPDIRLAAAQLKTGFQERIHG
ncbi:MAG: thiamine phosphate synthase [Clostridiales bacterium]|jgi:thiamine-phosphate pyrophosphorylase|nr:thiamine phosphate synthase [Clostridiales bacterium]